MQNVAVSPKPSSATELLTQKDVSRIKVFGDVPRSVWLRLKFKPGAQNFVNVGRTKINAAFCTSVAHDACALKPCPAEALLRDHPFGHSHLKSDASSGYVDRTVYSLSVSAHCAKKLSSQPGAKTVCASIWKEKSSRGSSRLSNNCCRAHVYDGLFAS